MYYSSGTTGKPKGILRPLGDAKFGEERHRSKRFIAPTFPLWRDGEEFFILPAPLYFAAPLVLAHRCSPAAPRSGDGEIRPGAGRFTLIERERVTHGFSSRPTSSGMLKLSEAERQRYDLTPLIRSPCGAPCPPGSSGRCSPGGARWSTSTTRAARAGFSFIRPEEWLAQPGTVGTVDRLGPPHIVDESGVGLPAGEIGTVYFEGGDARSNTTRINRPDAPPLRRARLGDPGRRGWLDADGYLYLTDRKNYMIISGGVNIYPQEIEDELITHPAVLDVAVFGVPHAEMGEEVKAVVQPILGRGGGPDLERELLAHCRERLGGYKGPRTVDFVEELPRLPNGKLLKRGLRDRYWGDSTSRIV